MISKKDYIEYLIRIPFNYTCTHIADHKEQISHDMVNRFWADKTFDRLIYGESSIFVRNVPSTTIYTDNQWIMECSKETIVLSACY